MFFSFYCFIHIIHLFYKSINLGIILRSRFINKLNIVKVEGKSMKNYYTIGEISKIYDIGRDSLRYYEEIGILNPSRDKNGYRLYKMQDIWKLNVIKDLKNLDFTMKQIKKYLDNRTVDS